MTTKTLLIGDIGGTNARFALARDDEPGFHDALTLKCADYASGDDAIQDYLSQVSAGSPDVVCLAAAGPVIDGTVRMTNNHWTLSTADITDDFRPDAVRLMNDFAAIAYSIPWLADSDHESIGLPKSDRLPDHDFTVAIVGPGTGLGTAGLCRRGDTLFPIVGEGGHIGFAPKSQVQLEILTALRDKFDRVSIERLVSGAGLENIYWALNLLYGEKRTQLSAREIFAHSIDGSDPRAVDSTHMFFEILGQVAGDLALTLGAEDGVYIAGGIAKRYPEMMHNSGFRNAFENKGRHRALMERIPTQLITHDEPGLLGVAYCALELSASS
ncbi:MAG: glucokinase [Gammaproteobacteria bacterium]|nr:glucokinase [Gammaproteobacteria bacterium]